MRTPLIFNLVAGGLAANFAMRRSLQRAGGALLIVGLAAGAATAAAQGMQTTPASPAPVYSPPSNVTGDTTMQRAPSPVRVVPNPGAASTQTTPRAPAVTPQRAAPSPGMRAVTPVQPARPVTPPRYTPPPTRQYR